MTPITTDKQNERSVTEQTCPNCEATNTGFMRGHTGRGLICPACAGVF